MTPEQFAASGVAARRLLEWAWATERRDNGLVIHAIQVVARSYGSDVAASGALLRRAITREHLAQFGADEGFHLTNELKHILPHDPEFVRDVYGAVFAFRETSDATSPMGSSRILAMTSTRRQDYNMAQYMLGELFSRFLERAAEHATHAAITVAEGYVRNEHDPGTGRKIVIEQFQFFGHQASLEHDGSCIWDSSSVHEKDAGLKIVGAVGPHIAKLVTTDPGLAHRCLELIARKGRMAIIWRRLLRAGANAPDTLGLVIRELAWAMPLLTCLDTCTEAGEFLSAVFPLLPEAERRRVEETILGIPDGKTEDALKWASHRRDILLGCLSRDHLTTDAARARLDELDAVGSVPENGPAFKMEVGWGGTVTTDDWLKREGVDVDAPAHRALLDLGEELKGLSLTQADVDGDTPASNDLAAKMQAMRDALHAGEAANADTEVLREGWGALAETAVRVAQLKVGCDRPLVKLVREILIAASTSLPRRAEPAIDADFDEHPGWSTPAPRVTAAIGLILLARQASCLGLDLAESITQLGLDPDPAVRFQIATRICLIHKSAPELMWSISDAMVANDKSAAVLQALMGQSLGQLWSLDPSRVVRIAVDLLGRFRTGPGVADLRRTCVQLIAALHVWHALPEATQALEPLLMARPVDLDDAAHLSTQLRLALVADKGPKDPDGGGVRHRAIALIHQFLEPAVREWEGVRGDKRPGSEWSPEEKERVQALLRFIDIVAWELYFASGTFEGGSDKDPVSATQRSRFLREGTPLMELIADVGIPRPTHHLLEMLEHNVSDAPHETFMLIVRALRAAELGGYQYESVGQELFVRLVEQYLAEHRRLFQEDEECCSGILAVLDIFVRAGWPSAQRLSYRLDEIFR